MGAFEILLPIDKLPAPLQPPKIECTNLLSYNSCFKTYFAVLGATENTECRSDTKMCEGGSWSLNVSDDSWSRWEDSPLGALRFQRASSEPGNGGPVNFNSTLTLL